MIRAHFRDLEAKRDFINKRKNQDIYNINLIVKVMEMENDM